MKINREWKVFWTPLAGTSDGCAKDPKCPGYSVGASGIYARRCKPPLKFGEGTEATGMEGMKANPGKKVFIKGT